jgi:L-asparaginase
MLIINTGGTFNKKYNILDGRLYVAKNDNAILEILSDFKNIDYKIKGIIYKDSLDLDDNDRKKILNEILNTNETNIIIIHGTDTMNKTASFLKSYNLDKNIILTGAMKPYEIDNKEASINISMCIGFLQSNIKNEIYICMSGIIDRFDKIIKDKNQGIFIRNI